MYEDELIEKWGVPDKIIIDFYGDVWSITEDNEMVVQYSNESMVEHIELRKNTN